MTTVDDVIFLIRSILCSRKDAISFKELNDEYYETNGMRVPFKEIGFNSLQEFLRNHPDKFRVNQMGADFSISAVLEQGGMADLARLVQGQKSSKKKKSKGNKQPIAYKKPSVYSNYSFKNSHISQSPSMQFNRYSSNNNYQQTNKKPAAPFKSHYQQHNKPAAVHKPSAAPVPKKPQPNEGPKILPTNLEKIRNIIRQQDQRGISPITVIDNGAASLDDYKITNAAYFLKEHMIFLSYVESVDKVYIRLIGQDFSVPFDVMILSLNEAMKTKKKLIDSKNTKENSICVGRHPASQQYSRLQIIKIDKEREDKFLCYFVDIGETRHFRASELFVLPDPKFMKLKFQAIEVKVTYFEMLTNSEYIVNQIKSKLMRKKYMGRRVATGTKQLTISLFNAKDECIDESFFKMHENFCQFKPTEGYEFCAFISFIDETSSLVYLQLPGNLKNSFDAKMALVNEYLQNLSVCGVSMNNDYFSRHVDDLVNEICLARYELDNLWYRVKIMRKFDDKTMYAHFIDFGNKEKVNINDLRIINHEFLDLKYLPPQAFTVLVVNSKSYDEELKDCLYETKLVNLKVVKVNSAGIPSVQIMSTVKTMQSNENSPSGDSEYVEIADQMNSSLFIKETVEESQYTDIRTVKLDELAETNLPAKSKVYVSCIINPVDFVIHLESCRKEYDLLKKKMNAFYANNPVKYLCKEPVKDFVYVWLNNETGECSRIKFVDYFAGLNARIYNIDSGHFDAVRIQSNFFFITREFLQLKPLGIKAKLSNVQIQNTMQSKTYFSGLVKDKKVFNAHIVKFDPLTNYFQIELHDDTGSSINKRLIDAGYARAC